MPSFEKMNMLYGKNDGAWVSLWVDLYMTHEDQVFIVDVVVANPTHDTMAMTIISWPTNVGAKLNIIVKICKYRRFHEKRHFIPIAMEVHRAPECDMDCFTKECARLFHNRQSRNHLVLSICI
jgi:hypothetical protein